MASPATVLACVVRSYGHDIPWVPLLVRSIPKLTFQWLVIAVLVTIVYWAILSSSSSFATPYSGK